MKVIVQHPLNKNQQCLLDFSIQALAQWARLWTPLSQILNRDKDSPILNTLVYTHMEKADFLYLEFETPYGIIDYVLA